MPQFPLYESKAYKILEARPVKVRLDVDLTEYNTALTKGVEGTSQFRQANPDYCVWCCFPSAKNCLIRRASLTIIDEEWLAAHSADESHRLEMRRLEIIAVTPERRVSIDQLRLLPCISYHCVPAKTSAAPVSKIHLIVDFRYDQTLERSHALLKPDSSVTACGLEVRFKRLSVAGEESIITCKTCREAYQRRLKDGCYPHWGGAGDVPDAV